MKITLCGSIAFIDEMHRMKSDLEQLGHKVDLPPLEQRGRNGNAISAKSCMRSASRCRTRITESGT